MYRGGGRQLFYDKRSHNVKWTREMEAQLEELVSAHCARGEKVDWEGVGARVGKPAWSCYNKHLQLSDPEWTEQEVRQLGAYYERNRSKPGCKLEEYRGVVRRHCLKMTLFKLEQITRWNRFRPRFHVPEDVLRRVE